jgi:phage protein D/phage baseplate assembly protein gpV
VVLAPTRTASFTVKVNGAKLPEDLWRMVTSVVVDIRSNAPDQFVITFRDQRHKAAESSVLDIGRTIEISALQPGGGTGVLTKGEITALEMDDDGTGAFFVVRGFDLSHRLHRGRHTRSFSNTKYSDIVQRIASEAGMMPSVDATRTVHDYVSQRNETNWHFLRRLAQEIGYELTADGQSLRFKKPERTTFGPPIGRFIATALPTQLVLGQNLHNLRMALTASHQPKKVIVHGWDPKDKRAVVATQGSVSSVMAAPDWGPESKLNSALSMSPEFTSVGHPYRSQSAAQEAADGIAERLASAHINFTATAFGDPRLKAGTAVSIGGVGRRMSGKYILTAARHVYDPYDLYRTEIAATGADDPSLFAATGGLDAPTGTHGPTGVVVAIVTDNKDPEDMGRVKVKYPWMPKDNGQELTSDWARVVNLWAGKEYGSFALPEVNDEVLVAFEHGDMDFPYVVGGLYNGKDKPKFPAAEQVKSGKVSKRGFWTRAKHRLVFTDEQGDGQGIELSTGDDNYYIKLDQKEKKITVECKESGAVMEMKAGKDITIEAGGDITFKTKGKFTVEAQGAIAVESKGGGLNLKAAMKAEMEGQSGVGVKSSGMAEVKGATVSLG